MNHNDNYEDTYEAGYRAAMNDRMKADDAAKNSGKLWIVIKSVVIYALFNLLILLVVATIAVTIENTSYGSRDGMESCKVYYDKGEYENLYETLIIYNCYDEEYDMYWEMSDGYNMYADALTYKTGTVRGIEGARAEYDRREKKFRAYIDGCSYDDNAKRLNMLLEELISAELSVR